MTMFGYNLHVSITEYVLQSFDEVEWKINEIKHFTFRQIARAKVNKTKRTVGYGSNTKGDVTEPNGYFEHYSRLSQLWRETHYYSGLFLLVNRVPHWASSLDFVP